MGKLAKQRRATMRDQLLKTTAANQRLTASLAAHKIGMDSAQSRADRLESKLKEIITALKQIDPRCAALPVDETNPIPDYFYRVPICARKQMTRLYAEAASPFAAAAVQQITHFLLYDCTLQGELAKTLHFRVKNAPGQQDFTTGYAVSEQMLRAMRHPEDVTRMICREFGHAIHHALHAKPNA